VPRCSVSLGKLCGEGQQTMRAWVVTLALGVLLHSCQKSEAKTCWLLLQGFGDSRWDTLQMNAPDALRRAHTVGDRALLELELERLPRVLLLRTATSCVMRVNKQSLRLARADEMRQVLTPLFEVTAPEGPLGPSAPVSIELRASCEEAQAGSIEWHRSGAPLIDMTIAANGSQLTAHTQSAAELLPEHGQWGIVAVSAQQRGITNLTATWTSADGERSVQLPIRIATLSRATGLPTVSSGQTVVLRGDQWHVDACPEGDECVLHPQRALTHFVPKMNGTWKLSDESQRQLRIEVGPPIPALDCGRSDCHRATTEITQHNPMIRGLSQRMTGFGADRTALDCALECHTVGEEGTEGSFVELLRELGHADLHAYEAWSQLPPLLQRAGSVGCVGCHGPAAIPEWEARWKIYSSDVCATCHDSPPRYGHVAAFRSTAMGRSDAHPELREKPGCWRCHTTDGFLESMGTVLEFGRVPPDWAEPQGLGCITCHDVHPGPPQNPGAAAHGMSTAGVNDDALLRKPPAHTVPMNWPKLADQSRICVPCHKSDPATGAASEVGPLQQQATTVDLLLGVGAVRLDTGEPLTAAAPHGQVPGGCVGCHSTGPSAFTHGRNHGFSVDPEGCRGCHDGTGAQLLRDTATSRSPPQQLQRRFTQLLEDFAAARLLPPDTERPAGLHARQWQVRNLAGVPQSTRRALHNLLLLAGDRGAYPHNPGYFELVLNNVTPPEPTSNPR